MWFSQDHEAGNVAPVRQVEELSLAWADDQDCFGFPAVERKRKRISHRGFGLGCWEASSFVSRMHVG